MSKIIIERKQSNSIRMPYSVLVDKIEIGQVKNGETIEFNIMPGEHVIIITSNDNDFAEKNRGCYWRDSWSIYRWIYG